MVQLVHTQAERGDSFQVIRRRPMLVTYWSIWIKPRLRLRYDRVRFTVDQGEDEHGRTRVMIVDEMDRAYWVRLTPRQHRMLIWRT